MNATATSPGCTGAPDLCGAAAGQACAPGCPSLADGAQRDYAAEYLAARLQVRAPAATLDESAAAADLSEEILDAADAAGVRLDPVELDEQARLALYPAP